MSTERASLCGLAVTLGLALAMILVGYDGNDESTCEELLDFVSSSAAPVVDYATVGAALGMLRDDCPAEYRTARQVLTDAGYYR